MHLTTSSAYKLIENLRMNFNMAEASQQQEQIHQFVDAYPEGIVLLTPVRNEKDEVIDFTYSYINGTAEKMLNRPKREMIGQKLLELFPGTDTEGIFNVYQGVYSSGKSSTLQFYYPHDGFNNWFRQKVEKFENGILVHTVDLGATSEPLKSTLEHEP